MQRTVEQSEELGVKIAFRLEPAEMQAAFDEVFEQFKGEIQLPGFRKGKAPRKLIETHLAKRFGKDFYVGSAIEKAVEKALKETLDEEKLIPYTPPQVQPNDLVEKYTDGSGLEFEAEFTKRPDIPEFVYKGIQVQIPRRTLSEEDIKLSLENIRIRLGESTPIEGRAAEPGDWAHVRLQAWHPEAEENRMPLFDNELDVQVRGGERTIPFLDDHLIGLKPGEEVEALEVVPADFVQPPFPSDTQLKLKITLQTLEEKVLPELTDELVSDKLGVYETVADLEVAIREQLDAHLSSSRREDLQAAVHTHLMTTVHFLLPQIAVENRYNDVRNNTIYQHKTEGRDLEAVWEADEAQKERDEAAFWDAAERSARLDFIADTVAEREGIKVADQELANTVHEMARQSNLGEADVQKLFQDRNFLVGVYSRILRSKAWMLILTQAEVEEVTVSPNPDVAQESALGVALQGAIEESIEAVEAIAGEAAGEEEE